MSGTLKIKFLFVTTVFYSIGGQLHVSIRVQWFWNFDVLQSIWIGGKILTSNYKIRFSQFLAISCKNGLLGSKNVRSSPYKVRNFFLEIGKYRYQKIHNSTLISKLGFLPLYPTVPKRKKNSEIKLGMYLGLSPI
jgi:hypothetical protein